MRHALLLVFSFLWCVPAHAILLSGSPLVTAACPQGVGLGDGCDAAPTDGVFKNASYFTAASVPHRMSWNVAGVDYPVGYSLSGAGGSLKDPATFAQAGCSNNAVSTGQIRCDANTPVINGYDLSMYNGVNLLFVGTTNAVVTNNRFGGTSYPGLGVGPMVLLGGSVGLDFEHNSVDGGCTVPNVAHNQATLLYTLGNTTNLTIKYNYFSNWCQQILEADGVTLSYQYNYIDNANIEAGGHQNYSQWSSGTATATISYNTSVQTAVGGAEGYQFYFNNTPATMNITSTNNTMAALNSGTMSYLMHGPAETGMTVGTCAVNNNYMDIVGAVGAFYPGKWTGCTLSTNINLTNGSAFANNP